MSCPQPAPTHELRCPGCTNADKRMIDTASTRGIETTAPKGFAVCDVCNWVFAVEPLRRTA